MAKLTAYVPLLDAACDVTTDGPLIAAVTPTETAPDVCLGPPLVDIQVNGYGGRTCCLTSPDQKRNIDYITRIFRELGVGWWVPTVCTNSADALAKAFALLAETRREDPELAAAIPGFHLEGPFISPLDGPRGAHPKAHVRPPDWDEFQRLQERADGKILYVTVAPEIEGALDFIRRCVAAGVVVSLGHSDMTRDDFQRAVDAGATLSTHLGNGIGDMIQRHNNAYWYQLASRDTFATFISDGHHLPKDCLYCMLRAKGLELSAVTSDCEAIAGLPPGRYGSSEVLASRRVVTVGTPYLAGSHSNQRECTERLIALGELGHADGWRLASLQPAKILGLDDRLGIRPGAEATFTVYRYNEDGPQIDVRETWVAGKKVYEAGVTPKTPLFQELESAAP